MTRDVGDLARSEYRVDAPRPPKRNWRFYLPPLYRLAVLSEIDLIDHARELRGQTIPIQKLIDALVDR
jgi:hypothetical protein